MRDFKKYEIWELGHKLTLDIYDVTQTFQRKKFMD